MADPEGALSGIVTAIGIVEASIRRDALTRAMLLDGADPADLAADALALAIGLALNAGGGTDEGALALLGEIREEHIEHIDAHG